MEIARKRWRGIPCAASCLATAPMHKSAGFCGFAAAGTAQATANTKAAESHTQHLNVSEEINASSNLKGIMQAVCQISRRAPADLSSRSDEMFTISQDFSLKLGNWVPNRPREMDNNRANFEQEMPRIVIVEDDDAMREFLPQTLMRYGCEAIAIANGADVLCALQDEGQYDLLLADVKMPGVNGELLARSVRCDKPGLRSFSSPVMSANCCKKLGIIARTTRCFRNRSNSTSWLKSSTGPLPLTSNTLSQAR